jgi:hypothetical protein
MSDSKPDSILDTVARTSRTKVKRNTSVQADVPPAPKALGGDLHKRTVRISDNADHYFKKLKMADGVSVDCLLEAIALHCNDNPETEAVLVTMAKNIGKDRLAKANRERAKTMSKNFLD